MICLDTGAAIDILRKKEVIIWLNSLSSESVVFITPITLFEIYRGIYLGSRIEEELKDFEEMLEYLEIIPLTQFHMHEAARTSVELQKKGISLDIRDLLIGICAREEGCVLKTRNRKHFVDIPELKLID